MTALRVGSLCKERLRGWEATLSLSRLQEVVCSRNGYDFQVHKEGFGGLEKIHSLYGSEVSVTPMCEKVWNHTIYGIHMATQNP